MNNNNQIESMTLTEYAEAFYAPNDNEMLVKMHIKGLSKDKILEYIKRYRSIDKSALGRYLGKINGRPIHESDDMMEASQKAGTEYNALLEEISKS